MLCSTYCTAILILAKINLIRKINKGGFGTRPYTLTAIKLSVHWNAKPQLGIGNLPAKLGLGVPSRADLTLNVS